jgi:hypothetical protein
VDIGVLGGMGVDARMEVSAIGASQALEGQLAAAVPAAHAEVERDSRADAQVPVPARAARQSPRRSTDARPC